MLKDLLITGIWFGAAYWLGTSQLVLKGQKKK